MEVWKRAADVAIWSYGGLVERCRCSNLEVRGSGGALRTWGRGGKEVWRYRALEARCRRADVEEWRYGALEARCRRSDVEVWKSGGTLQACSHSGMEVRSSEALKL